MLPLRLEEKCSILEMRFIANWPNRRPTTRAITGMLFSNLTIKCIFIANISLALHCLIWVFANIIFVFYLFRDSLSRGWRLIMICTAYFDCSQWMKPYLLKYLSLANNPKRDIQGTLECDLVIKTIYWFTKWLLGHQDDWMLLFYILNFTNVCFFGFSSCLLSSIACSHSFTDSFSIDIAPCCYPLLYCSSTNAFFAYHFPPSSCLASW